MNIVQSIDASQLDGHGQPAIIQLGDRYCNDETSHDADTGATVHKGNVWTVVHIFIEGTYCLACEALGVMAYVSPAALQVHFTRVEEKLA